jgi:zinc protease
MKLLIVLIMMVLLTTVARTQDVDRTKRPKGKPAPTVQLPQIQKAKLANGLNVWLVEHSELPTVSLNLVIQAGSDHDPMGQPGIASMTADVLDEGTTTRDALQISEELEAIGASLSVGSSFDGSFVGLSTLTKSLDKALELYADVIVHPTFPEKEFDRLRNQRLTALVQQRDQPTTIANNAFSFILYGPNHPYGSNPGGTEGSIGTMKRDDLEKFYQSYYRPNNSTLLVVGKVTMKEIQPKLERALAHWKPSDVPKFTLPDAPKVAERKIYLIDKPGAAQSEFRIGYPALARNTPDFFPVVVMNRALGGQFTSRINLNLREKHGYTYGARSAFSFQKGPGPFTASAGVVTDKSDSALREFLYELDLMRKDGMSADELEYVKKGIIGSFALTFETPSQIASILQNVILYGLPEDYYNTYLQRIDAVTAADVQRVAEKYLDTSTMAVVIVGDLATIKNPILAGNFGEVVVCDLDGRPMP